MKSDSIVKVVDALLADDSLRSATVLVSAREKITATTKTCAWRRGEFHEILLTYGMLNAEQKRKFKATGPHFYTESRM